MHRHGNHIIEGHSHHMRIRHRDLSDRCRLGQDLHGLHDPGSVVHLVVEQFDDLAVGSAEEKEAFGAHLMVDEADQTFLK